MSSRFAASEEQETSAQAALVDGWLMPLEGAGCGENLEYEPAFLELSQAIAGKPESQFAPAEPPNWQEVRDLCEGLLERTRDLRVALHWSRAMVNLDGIEALPDGLRLLHGLMERYWEHLHPMPDPDDGDTFARTSVLGSIDKLDGLLGDVRQAVLTRDRRLNGLRTRDVEIALDQLAPRVDESPPNANQIEGMMQDLPELATRLRRTSAHGRQYSLALQSLMNEKLGVDNSADVTSLKRMLDAIQSVVPQQQAATDPSTGHVENPSSNLSSNETAGGSERRPNGPIGIQSRQDAIKAIKAICAYLERSEPSNPAQLLLRRAERLIEWDFLQLIRELAPDAVSEVARIMGVDPDSIGRHGED